MTEGLPSGASDRDPDARLDPPASVPAQPTELRADVVVVGGGVAGLVAALECAKVGLKVALLERRDELGGCVGRIELDGLTVDSGAESFATRGGTVAELLATLGLDGEIVDPNRAGAWLAMPGSEGRPTAAPLPKTGMLGIPANPLGDDVRRIIGWRGATRAYVDRLMPILRIGRAHSLGELVRTRMGAAVLDRLVTPISAGVYSADPDDLDIDVVAPGLNEAMTRTGSLSGGVGQLVEERRAGSAVRGLRGGMHRLVDALVAELRRFDVTVVTAADVVDLERLPSTGIDGAAGAGTARSAAGTAASAPAVSTSDTPEWRVAATTPDGDLNVDTRFVILAAPAQTSRRLLADAVDGWVDAADWPAAASVEIVTLVLDAPALDAAPRGTGVLVAADTEGVTAKALTHSTAKWAWLAERAAPRHVVRLSYGRAGEPSPLDGLTDDEVARLAVADASALLGVPIEQRMLRASGRTAWRDALSHASLGQRDRVQELEDALAAEPTIEATGSWIAGTGLASVVPHAHDTAHRVRHRALHLDGIA